MPRPPGPERPDPFSPFLPPRTRGPLGINDAADPSVKAYPGDTPGTLGVNDGAAYQARNVAAVAGSGRVKVPRHLVIQVPKTKKIVNTLSGNTTGGGRFKIHCDGMSNPKGVKTGALNTKWPDVKVTFNKKKLVYEIKSIVIYTLMRVNNPDPKALPVVGKNVTNDPKLGVRTPADIVKSKGYWKKVIENMERYQYRGNSKGGSTDLKWYAAKSTDYHEGIHNQQFRAWLKKKTFFILRKLEHEVNDRLKSYTRLTKKDVEIAAQKVMKSLIPDGFGNGTAYEIEAYTKTYHKIWVPVIQKIKTDARKAGWK